MGVGSTGDGEAGRGWSLTRVLTRRWRIVAAATIIGAALGFGASLLLPPTYRASARVFLNTESLSAGNSNVDLRQAVQTQAQLASSTRAIADIAGRLQLPTDRVADLLAATPGENGYFFTITGSGPTQAEATRLVTTSEEVYRELVGRYGSVDPAYRQQLVTARDKLQAELNQLQSDRSPSPATIALRDARANQLAEINKQITDADIRAGVGAVSLAEPPHEDGKVAPSMVVLVLVGALFGFFTAAAIVCIDYQRRPTVLSGRHAADALGVPLLAGGPAAESSGLELTDDSVVSAVSTVLVRVPPPGVKLVALTPAAAGDLRGETVAAIAASWSDYLGVVLILDAARSEVRQILERLPPSRPGEPSHWTHEPGFLGRSSQSGKGRVLYLRTAASVARPGGLAPIVRERGVADIVIILTPPLSDLPTTAALALQADAVVVITSPKSRVDVLSVVRRDWPDVADRILGVVHDTRPRPRRSGAGGAQTRSGPSPAGSPPPAPLTEPLGSPVATDGGSTPPGPISGRPKASRRRP